MTTTNDWLMTTLLAVRDLANKIGRISIAEQLDVAILIAANEEVEHEDGLEQSNASEESLSERGTMHPQGNIRRYH